MLCISGPRHRAGSLGNLQGGAVLCNHCRIRTYGTERVKNADCTSGWRKIRRALRRMGILTPIWTRSLQQRTTSRSTSGKSSAYWSGFVASQPLWAFTWSPSRLRDANAIENCFNLGRFMLLSGRYFDGKGHSRAVSNQVEFAAESAS